MKMAGRIRLAGAMLAAVSLLVLFPGSGRSQPASAASPSAWGFTVEGGVGLVAPTYLKIVNVSLGPGVHMDTEKFGWAVPGGGGWQVDVLADCKNIPPLPVDLGLKGPGELKFGLATYGPGLNPPQDEINWVTGGDAGLCDRHWNTTHATPQLGGCHARFSIQPYDCLKIEWEDREDAYADWNWSDCIVELCPLTPVGGIAELPDLAQPAAAGQSASSHPPHTALAGGLAAGVLALGAGAWYARRRWLR